MKKIKTIFLTFFLALVNVSIALAGTNPLPRPMGVNDPPGDPGAPIDQNLAYLVIAGLILGASVIYRNKIKKASM